MVQRYTLLFFEELSESKTGEYVLYKDYLKLLRVIRNALKIEALWIPAVASEEYLEEVKALHLMRQSFLNALNDK